MKRTSNICLSLLFPIGFKLPELVDSHIAIVDQTVTNGFFFVSRFYLPGHMYNERDQTVKLCSIHSFFYDTNVVRQLVTTK